MNLQSCFPVGLDISVEIEHGDVVGLSLENGIIVLSVNGELIGNYDHLLLRADAAESQTIPEWGGEVKKLATEIVELWQAELPAGEEISKMMKMAGIFHNKVLGDYLELTGQSVYRWRQNQVLPSERTILKFRQLFGV